MCALQRKGEGESACVRISRGCFVFELLFLQSDLMPADVITFSLQCESFSATVLWGRGLKEKTKEGTDSGQLFC